MNALYLSSLLLNNVTSSGSHLGTFQAAKSRLYQALCGWNSQVNERTLHTRQLDWVATHPNAQFPETDTFLHAAHTVLHDNEFDTSQLTSGQKAHLVDLLVALGNNEQGIVWLQEHFHRFNDLLAKYSQENYHILGGSLTFDVAGVAKKLKSDSPFDLHELLDHHIDSHKLNNSIHSVFFKTFCEALGFDVVYLTVALARQYALPALMLAGGPVEMVIASVIADFCVPIIAEFACTFKKNYHGKSLLKALALASDKAYATYREMLDKPTALNPIINGLICWATIAYLWEALAAYEATVKVGTLFHSLIKKGICNNVFAYPIMNAVFTLYGAAFAGVLSKATLLESVIFGAARGGFKDATRATLDASFLTKDPLTHFLPVSPRKDLFMPQLNNLMAIVLSKMLVELPLQMALKYAKMYYDGWGKKEKSE